MRVLWRQMKQQWGGKPGRWHCYSKWMSMKSSLEEVAFELRPKKVRE